MMCSCPLEVFSYLRLKISILFPRICPWFWRWARSQHQQQWAASYQWWCTGPRGRDARDRRAARCTLSDHTNPGLQPQQPYRSTSKQRRPATSRRLHTSAGTPSRQRRSQPVCGHYLILLQRPAQVRAHDFPGPRIWALFTSPRRPD